MLDNKNILWGLFLLRFGLSIFLIMWSLDKIFEPHTAVKVFEQFYSLSISPSIAMIIGSVELTISLFMLFGLYKSFSYFLGLVIHLISTLSSYKQLLDPFGENHLFIASIPVLFAFLSLFIMRKFDTKWSFTKKKGIFT